ncbi:uncharacterized protein [Haliotis asinina]|uniref:uncharacterized protein n=1 Tax=Haliotis asinina TaxID=109174 RepID=UPI00353239CF
MGLTGGENMNKMHLIVTVVTIYKVLSPGFCQGQLVSQATLIKNTPALRTFVCMCSDAASCTADKWEDLLERCRQMTKNIKHEITSEKAGEETQPTTTSTQRTTTPASCVVDCSGVGNGKYQSCERCDGYVECSHGNTYKRPCLTGTLWNDKKKNCLHPPSPTCVPNA